MPGQPANANQQLFFEAEVPQGSPSANRMGYLLTHKSHHAHGSIQHLTFGADTTVLEFDLIDEELPRLAGGKLYDTGSANSGSALFECGK